MKRILKFCLFAVIMSVVSMEFFEKNPEEIIKAHAFNGSNQSQIQANLNNDKKDIKKLLAQQFKTGHVSVNKITSLVGDEIHKQDEIQDRIVAKFIIDNYSYFSKNGKFSQFMDSIKNNIKNMPMPYVVTGI